MIENALTQEPIELAYWDIRGVAQPLRHLLEFLNIAYKPIKCDCPKKWFGEDIEEIKKNCLFAGLPYINDNGFYLCEVVAIAKYLCKKGKRRDLLGKTLDVEIKIDELLCKFLITRMKMAMVVQCEVPQDQEEKKSKLDRLKINLINDQYFQVISGLMLNESWLFGDLTIADFFIFESCFYITGVFPQVLQEFPQVDRYMKRFLDIQAIKKYTASDRMVWKIIMEPLTSMKYLWKGDRRHIDL